MKYVRNYHNLQHLGPLADNRELITRFVTDINNNMVSYGDENGLEILRRTKNNKLQPIAGNYFPQTTRLYIENNDGSNRLTLITDRAHGII